MTEKEEKGFFQRIKEVFTGEEEEEKEESPSQEEILQNTAIAEIEAQDEEELNRIAEAAVEKASQSAGSRVEGEQKQKRVPSKVGLQKVSAGEMEANPENKPVIEALKTVVDPELQIDIWTLGLIYNIETKQEQKEVNILMTFTSIMCPVGPMIVQHVDMALKKLSHVHKVNVEVTFSPPWEPTEELREMLGV